MMIFVQDFEIISDIISTFERNYNARTAFLPGLALKSHFRKRHHHSGFLQVGVLLPRKKSWKEIRFFSLDWFLRRWPIFLRTSEYFVKFIMAFRWSKQKFSNHQNSAECRDFLFHTIHQHFLIRCHYFLLSNWVLSGLSMEYHHSKDIPRLLLHGFHWKFHLKFGSLPLFLFLSRSIVFNLIWIT